jgi:signal transduction histidine kinase
MSRLSYLWKRFFLKASVRRTYAETLLLFLVLAITMRLIYQANTGQVTINAVIFFVNPFSALDYTLRLRIPRGRWLRRFGLDWLALLVPTLILNPLVWGVMRAFLMVPYTASNDTQFLDLLFIGMMAFHYFFFRIGTRFLVWWNELRQRRMIWSLVTSTLVTVATLQVLLVLPLALAMLFSWAGDMTYAQIPASPFAQFLYRLQMFLPLLGLAILFGTAILIVLLPVSIAVSYLFARRIRRRLDALLDAAHAARDGDYNTQVRVSGHDEIARLQSDFNTMTVNLKINVDDLRDEREKVAALLTTRRELMANVSHELRTPIATVRAYLDSALRQQENNGDVTISQNDLAIIQRETLRLQILIDDLFALSRAEVDQLALKSLPMDSVALIQRVIETVAPLAWRINRVEIVAKLPTWLPQIVADESRLEQVLRNLIHNSLRHTPPGGLIIVSAREVGGQAEIQVQDTGEGISAEHLPHIWERYYRDAENGGTGLGLALVKSFIEAMHGQVAVSSAPGEGACFTIALPLDNPSHESEPTIPKPQPVPRSVSAKSPASLR